MHVMRLENRPGDCVPQVDCRDAPSIEVIGNALKRGQGHHEEFQRCSSAGWGDGSRGGPGAELMHLRGVDGAPK